DLNAVWSKRLHTIKQFHVAGRAENACGAHGQAEPGAAYAQRAAYAIDQQRRARPYTALAQTRISRAQVTEAGRLVVAYAVGQSHQRVLGRRHVFAQAAVRIVFEHLHGLVGKTEIAVEGPVFAIGMAAVAART